MPMKEVETGDSIYSVLSILDVLTVSIHLMHLENNTSINQGIFECYLIRNLINMLKLSVLLFLQGHTTALPQIRARAMVDSTVLK